MRLRWYVTDLPFLLQNADGGTTNNCKPGPQPIPEALPTVINSRDWDPEPWVDRPVGEVPTWSDDRKYNGQWTPPPALDGLHVCHPDYFPTGEPYPPTLPPADYDRFGIPVCCRHPIPVEGGVEIGGENPPGEPEYREATGGVEVGGDNPPSPPQTRAAIGGVEVGGSNPPSPPQTRAAIGGVEVGGSNQPTLTHMRSAIGGVEVGGANDPTPSVQRDARGGVEVGGECPPVVNVIRDARGGVEVGGSVGPTVLPYFVQANSTVPSGVTSPNPRSLSFVEPVTFEHVLVVAVATSGAVAGVAVSDSLGSVYTQVGDYATNGAMRVSLWVASAAQSDTCQVTVEPTASVRMAFAIAEYQPPFFVVGDNTSTNTGASTSALTTGVIDPSGDVDLFLGALSWLTTGLSASGSDGSVIRATTASVALAPGIALADGVRSTPAAVTCDLNGTASAYAAVGGSLILE